MSETIASLLEYGYIILFVYSLGGGMVAILAAGVLSAGGHFSLSLCIVLAFVANTLGSTLLFILGKYYKKDLMPYFKKHRRKLALAQMKIKQYGVFLLLLQKFIYGLKTFIPMAAGLAKFNFLKFFIINTFASLLWAIALGYAGFAFGAVITPFMDTLGTYPYLVPLFLLVLIVLIWFYLSSFSKKTQ
ncbi:hypothetical protein DMB95_07360 [Campylobacter sp. MIT 12-8780]|uniref:DedA family protein n=1 Tax=unclassified Campylobacter TaxID=2593542 RepID=UPI00115E0895|nr:MULTISPECIES: DedA family protein [unclassified Campylobacter]NDJ27898.1 DedA family protein [Campylobacter sp. MIT 19-121]TQR40641.1 hypothetical protein DMB95_07360 [Campylobacter sp. MIT 12-8780]